MFLNFDSEKDIIFLKKYFSKFLDSLFNHMKNVFDIFVPELYKSPADNFNIHNG